MNDLRTVYFNGQFVPEAQARVSIYDSALSLGDMAFEVTRTCRGQPFRLDAHLERLFHSLEVLLIDPRLSIGELRELTLETLRRNAATESAEMDWNIIHNISRGPATGFLEAFDPADRRPTVLISCFPLAAKMVALAPAYQHGIDLVVPQQRAIPGVLLDASIKTRSRIHYQLANLQAAEKRPGAWAVLVDPDGFLTEGASGNVFVARSGELRTPAVRNLLPGVTRSLVLDLAELIGVPARETDLTPQQAAEADEIFLTSTSIGILHARSWEGRLIADGAAGTITRRLRDALSRTVGLDFGEQAQAWARAARQPAAPPQNPNSGDNVLRSP